MKLEIERVEEPADFDRIVANQINNIISAGGEIDIDQVKTNLQALNVTLSGSFDPRALANDLTLVAGMKDRAIEIVRKVTDSHLAHKSAMEILTKGWPRMSTATSAEKRIGEAQLKLSNFITEAAAMEGLYRYSLSVMHNLESKQEAVNRQISCAQAAVKILDRYSFEGNRQSEPEPAIMERFRSGEEPPTPTESNATWEDRQAYRKKSEDNVTNWDQLGN